MSLRLELTLVDSESKPVEGAEVRFKDVAPPLAQRDDGRVLGFTASDGVLKVDVTHEWSDYFSANRRADSGAFDLLIHARNDEHVVRHFVIECLSKEDDRYVLKLRVSLSRSRDSVIIL